MAVTVVGGLKVLPVAPVFHVYVPSAILFVPIAVNVNGLLAQTAVSGVMLSVPVARRNVTESVFLQPFVPVIETVYLLLSVVGVAVGALDVVDDKPVPVQTYACVDGAVFKTSDAKLQTVLFAGKVTVGNGFTVTVVEAEPGQSPILALTVNVPIIVLGFTVILVLPSVPGIAVPLFFHFQSVTFACVVFAVIVNEAIPAGVLHIAVSRGSNVIIGNWLTIRLTES